MRTGRPYRNSVVLFEDLQGFSFSFWAKRHLSWSLMYAVVVNYGLAFTLKANQDCLHTHSDAFVDSKTTQISDWKQQAISLKTEICLSLEIFGCQLGKHGRDCSPPSKVFKWGCHICVFSAAGGRSCHKPEEPEAGMMSLWGLCSAWSVPLWLQSDSLLEEFNLHHTPHQSSLPFYQSIFRGITPTDLSQPGLKCTSAFKL